MAALVTAVVFEQTLSKTMNNKSTALAAAALACGSAMAQLPVPLLDQMFGNDAIVANQAQWKTVAPIMQAALECRQKINRDDQTMRLLLPSNDVMSGGGRLCHQMDLLFSDCLSS